jgi:hypothetical protein
MEAFKDVRAILLIIGFLAAIGFIIFGVIVGIKRFFRNAPRINYSNLQSEQPETVPRTEGSSHNTFESPSHPCDICSQTIHQPDGFCLTTRQVVSTPAYWQGNLKIFDAMSNTIGKGDDMDLIRAILPSLKSVADSDTPWIVCQNCIGLFSVDRAQMHEYAVLWWQSSKSFEPPGNGSVSVSEIRLPTDKYRWAEVINLLIRDDVRLETFERPK